MKIAVVGATGLVGRKVLNLLEQKNICTASELVLFASSKSTGTLLNFKSEKVIVNELKNENIKKYDYAIFCAGGAISKKFAKIFTRKGCIVIDNSSAFRRNKNVPLVVPEINMFDINNSRLIANPNCSTIGASLPLFAILKKYEINRIIISTYQAVSGAGKTAIDDLNNNTTNKLNYLIKNNLIPQIDKPLKNGYTYEEDKMNFELQKILHKKLAISTTCVRVPVENCHSETIYIELNKKPNLKIIKELISNMQGVELIDDIHNNKYPMPLNANGQENVFVGRIRKDTSCEYAMNMFISFDNILKGAALNAVQILEKLIKK